MLAIPDFSQLQLNTNGGRVLVIVGPSGSGKSAFRQMLLERHPVLYGVRYATTRPRRPDEGDGDYDFVTEDIFQGYYEEDQLLEWVKYSGNWYGALRAPVEEALLASRPVLFVLAYDLAGIFLRDCPDVTAVFLRVSEMNMKERMIARGNDICEVVARLHLARRENDWADFNAMMCPNLHLIDDLPLEEVYSRIESIFFPSLR